MVYKKYIYRDGKKFGPYYFKSIRTKEGKVKSVYLGKEKPANNFRVLPFLIVVLFLFSFLGLFSYSGFSTVDLFSQNSTEIQVEGVSENISVEDGEINITEIINNTEVNSSLNETTRINMTINNTKLNSSLNETIDINLTETEGGDIINYSKIIDDDNSSFKFEEKSGSAPILQSSRIDPTNPDSTSTLYGFCNATDSESDRLTYCYEWYNDEIFNQSECEGAPGFCYQESSNVSTVCGGLDTGTYSCDDNWWSAIGYGCDKAYDGDWDTNGFSQMGVTANMYINYTKPFGAVIGNSFWQVKDAGMGGNAINLTIPLECWEYEILQFNVRSSLSSNLAEWYCLNDTGWELMREYASSGAVWEEAMIWNFSDHAPGEEINLTFLANGFISKGQNWTFNCMANDGTINASNWLNTSVLIAGIPPIVQSSRIDPINPTSSNDLIGYCNATGADNDLLLYYYEWYNDGVLNQTGNTLNYSIIEDDTEDAWNSTGTFAKAASRAVDENWGTGNQVNSMGVEGITFINYTKPNNLEGAKIEYKYSNGAGCDAMNTLDCYTGSTWTNIDNWTGEVSSTIETSTLPTTCYDDEDTIQIKLYQKCSDSVTLTSSNFAEEKMWWNISGESYVEEGIETEVNNLDSEYVSKGQNWTFNCMAFDSIYNASSWINTSVLIGNSPPIMQTARINPASPYTSDNLEGFCNATDIDGDNVTYYFEWYNETEFHSSGKSYTCYPSHNDNLDGTCTVTLRPNAVGNMPEFSDYPSAGDSYLKVDDSLVDEDSTYVYKKNIGGSQSAQIALRENSVTTYFTKAAIATYSTFSSVRTTRPSDNSDWTISDIDSLQIGAREAVSDTTDLYNLPASNIPVGSTIDQVETYFRARIFTDKFGDPNMRVTQVYAEATYSPSADYFEEGVETNIYDLSSDNTAKYQNWTFNCTAFDGDDNSSYWENDSVTIFNTAPYTVSLTDPENNSTITNRIPSLQWNEPNDADSDSLTYHLLVDNNLDFSSPIINLSPPGEGISELYHVPSSDLSLDTLYYWKVRAYDGDEFGPFSNVWNFTVESLVEISLTTDGINFGTKGLGEKNDTTDDNPYPFVLQNDGNCLINVSLNATDLFSGTPTGGMDNYQFKVDNVSVEPGSFNWGQSVTEWYGLPPAGKLPVAISDLKYEHATDSAQIEIDFTIPEDELPGNKNSTITLIAEIIE